MLTLDDLLQLPLPEEEQEVIQIDDDDDDDVVVIENPPVIPQRPTISSRRNVPWVPRSSYDKQKNAYRPNELVVEDETDDNDMSTPTVSDFLNAMVKPKPAPRKRTMPMPVREAEPNIGYPFLLSHQEEFDGIRLKEPELELKCSVCHQIFSSVMLLLDHRLFDHGYEAMLQCGDCGQKFKKRIDARNHIVMEKEVYQCTGCGRCFGQKGFLESHLSHNKCIFEARIADIKCSACPQKFESIELLVEHRYDEHGIEAMLTCNNNRCRAKYDNKFDVLEHSKLEYGMYSCSKCKRTIKDRKLIKIHESKCIVGEEKTCSCTLCPEAFHFPSELIHHREVEHGLDIALICGLCGEQFKTKYAAHRHLVSEYKKGFQEDEDPFAEDDPKFIIGFEDIRCSICNDEFDTVDLLLNHRKANHGKRAFLRCGICDFRGEHRSHISTHIIKELELYKCSTCERLFINQEKLDWHLQKFPDKDCRGVSPVNMPHFGKDYDYSLKKAKMHKQS